MTESETRSSEPQKPERDLDCLGHTPEPATLLADVGIAPLGHRDAVDECVTIHVARIAQGVRATLYRRYQNVASSSLVVDVVEPIRDKWTAKQGEADSVADKTWSSEHSILNAI